MEVQYNQVLSIFNKEIDSVAVNTLEAYLKVNSFFFFFILHCVVCGILVPQSRIEPMHPEVEARTANHWASWEALDSLLIDFEISVVLEGLRKRM